MAVTDQIAELQATVRQLNSTVDQLLSQAKTTAMDDSLPRIFNLVCGIFVFSMQVGFSLLEAGMVRTKNTRAIMVKNVLDTCVCAIAFWMFGYAIGFGSGSSIIGWKYGSESHHNDKVALFTRHDQGHFFFQFTFAATSSTIIAGAVAERTQLSAYLIYNFVLSSMIYPVIAHVIWSHDGLLTARGPGQQKSILGTVGVLDTAGSMVVHVTGGVTSLVGAYLVGPRIGRFDIDGNPVRFKPHSLIFTAAGTILLWFGFYGFNAGSLYYTANYIPIWVDLTGRICVNTTLCAATSAMTVFAFLQWQREDRRGTMDDIFNGVIGGLVAACATCAVVEPYASVVIGIGAGLAYLGGTWLTLRCQIDDAVMAAATHLCCGSWGALAAGLFATKEGVQLAYQIPDPISWGLFYGGGWKQLGVQLVGLLLVYAWVGTTTFVLFYLMATFGALRIARQEEEVGMDVAFHGRDAADDESSIVMSRHGRRGSGVSGTSDSGRGGFNMVSMRNRLSRGFSRNIPTKWGTMCDWSTTFKGRGSGWHQMAWNKALRTTPFGQFALAMYEANYIMEDMGEVEVSGSGVYMAVHDGHGGAECATYLQENLYKNMIQCFLKDRGVVSTVGLDQAFQVTDEDFATTVRDHFAKVPHLATVGACSVVAVATGSMLYIANVGDCRAVLGRLVEGGDIVAVQLSNDHNVNIEEERTAYLAEHRDEPNLVWCDDRGRHRIKGKIQVSRAFGDWFMKAAEFNTDPLFPKFRVPEPFNPPLLSVTPAVAVHALETEDDFLILASDGLWEYVSNQEAADIVHTSIRKDAAKMLIREAVQRAARKHEISYEELVAMSMGPRREYHDDITVIVFFFNHAARIRKRQKNLFWEQSLSLKGGQEVQLALKTQKSIHAHVQSREGNKGKAKAQADDNHV